MVGFFLSLGFVFLVFLEDFFVFSIVVFSTITVSSVFVSFSLETADLEVLGLPFFFGELFSFTGAFSTATSGTFVTSETTSLGTTFSSFASTRIANALSVLSSIYCPSKEYKSPRKSQAKYTYTLPAIA